MFAIVPHGANLGAYREVLWPPQSEDETVFRPARSSFLVAAILTNPLSPV